MKVLGIITCQILELEFDYLLARDPDIGCISIIEDDFSAGFIKAVDSNGCNKFHRIARLGDSSPRQVSAQLEAIVPVMESGLHNRKRLLQQALVEATQEMAQHVNTILGGEGWNTGICLSTANASDQLWKRWPRSVPHLLEVCSDSP